MMKSRANARLAVVLDQVRFDNTMTLKEDDRAQQGSAEVL